MISYRRRISRKLWLGALKNKNFTIVSNDCWGGEVYRDFNLPYATPFVGAMLMAPCYVKLIRDLRGNLASPLTFAPRSKYAEINQMREAPNKPFPIGRLNCDIEIQFLHYDSEEEASQKWTRRVSRMHWDNLFIKFDASKAHCTDELLREFDALPFKQKVCLSAERKPHIASLVPLEDWVLDGKAMYKISIKQFNVLNWLNGGSGKVTLPYQLLLAGLGLKKFNQLF